MFDFFFVPLRPICSGAFAQRTYKRVRTHKRAQANRPNEKQKMAQEIQTYNPSVAERHHGVDF